MITVPFFSVCIPSYNRENTIFNTLSSILNQKFTDFEVLIVDCSSTDNTRAEIERFFASSMFKEHSFVYQYICKDYIPETVEDWNEPIRLATGKYIAMLEGDDRFLPNRLMLAHQYLSKHEDVGIYATGNTNNYMFKHKGYVSAQKYISFLSVLEDVPPPSQTIFIRMNTFDNKPYFYNDKAYIYAPETELYVSICKDGYNAFFSENNTVYRHPSSRKIRDSWTFYHDQFYVLKTYRKPVTFQKTLYSFYKKIRLMKSCCYAYYMGKSKEFKRQVIENRGWIRFYTYYSVYYLLKQLISIKHKFKH
jgi:glycosyltransferase involved in cell wall biosynthesis